MKLPVRLFILVSFLMIAGMLSAQLSPGELSRAHSHLEGLSNCTKCHLLGEKVSSQKCQECHTEIKLRIELGRGFHASPAVKGKECFSCHSDHHGLNFQLIKFDKEKFNHESTGFKLQGAHAKKRCIDCHNATLIKEQKIKKRKNTYLGLDHHCESCHADYHQKTLSSDCAGCHNADAFKPASNFNHDRASFKLIGKHKDVACVSCHKTSTRDGKKFQEFTGLRFSTCTACHTDQHQGKFGQNCRDCHSEQSFTQIKGTDHFDHSKTDFKLEGKHQQVTCKACHKNKLTDPLKYGQCKDCHSDYHEQQFERQGQSPDCSQCHTVNGFPGANYTLEQHNQSAFPLKDAHLATPCFACHKKTTKWNFRNIGSNCVDCHTDIHENIIGKSYYPNSDCKVCHKETNWSKVTFDHSKTKFTLTGAHIGPTCRSCHFTKSAEGKSVQRFSGLSVSCQNCHKDVHNNQFAISDSTDCSRCHLTEKFIPASQFDHSKTNFPLDGKHKGVACIKCHQSVTKQEFTYVLYKTGKLKCEDCHQ